PAVLIRRPGGVTNNPGRRLGVNPDRLGRNGSHAVVARGHARPGAAGVGPGDDLLVTAQGESDHSPRIAHRPTEHHVVAAPASSIPAARTGYATDRVFDGRRPILVARRSGLRGRE